MAGAKIQGSTSGNLMEVNDATSPNVLQVVHPTTVTNAGYAAVAGAAWDGTTGLSRTVRRADISDRNRLRVAVDSPFFFEQFTGTTINTGQWFQSSTTMTITVSGGFLNLNAGSSVATTTNAFVKSYRTFPYFQDAGLRLDMVLMVSSSATANSTLEFGLGIGNTGTTAPTDGAFFRVTGTGNITAVATNNSTEQTVNTGVALVGGNRYALTIFVDQTGATYYINGIPYAIITPSASSSGITACNTQQVFFRNNNTGATSVAQELRVTSVSVNFLDLGAGRPWSDALAGAGFNAIQPSTGFASAYGSTANYANSAAPGSAVLSNTATAGTGYTGLGGQWQFAALAGAETDFILFGYQLPIASAVLQGRSFYCTGILIDMINTGATGSAATWTLNQFGVATGSTAVSLATTEGAGTKIPRRTAIGNLVFPSTAPIGQQSQTGTNLATTPTAGYYAQRVQMNFPVPYVANTGEYFYVVIKAASGAATASQVIRGTVMLNGYFE